LALSDVNDRTASDSFDKIDKTHLRVVALTAAATGGALPALPARPGDHAEMTARREHGATEYTPAPHRAPGDRGLSRRPSSPEPARIGAVSGVRLRRGSAAALERLRGPVMTTGPRLDASLVLDADQRVS
jgi:hypothetical protein